MIYFCTLETGGVIDSWKNPYTGRTVPVIHWATLGESGYTYTTRGLVARSTFRGEFGALAAQTFSVAPRQTGGLSGISGSRSARGCEGGGDIGASELRLQGTRR